MAQSQMSPKSALLQSRIIWGALLAGQVLFMFFAASQALSGEVSEDSKHVGRVLFWASVGMWFLLMPLGMFIRNQIYKANWVGSSVAPKGYLSGTIVFLGMMEAVVLQATAGIFISHEFWPLVVPVFLALAVQLINFPNGKPMESRDVVGEPAQR